MTDPRRTHPNAPAFMNREAHARLWRLVEGAVVDAMKSHPDYFTEKGRASAVQSITKRVVGSLVGQAKEAQTGGRFGGSRTAPRCHAGAGSPTCSSVGEGVTVARLEAGGGVSPPAGGGDER